MSIFRIFGFGRKLPSLAVRGISTVKFDPRRVTPEVKKDVRAAIAGLPEIPTQLRGWLFDVAIESMKRGRDLGFLTRALIEAEIPGIDRAAAISIARYLHNRTTSLMQKNSHLSLGITQAKWLHSKSDCFPEMEGYGALTEAHACADGKIYEISKGLMIGGVPKWPGRDDGCKCVSIPIIPGFDR